MKAFYPPLSNNEYLAAELAASKEYTFSTEGIPCSDPELLLQLYSDKSLHAEYRELGTNDCCSPEEQDVIQEITAAEITISESLTQTRPLPCQFFLGSIAAGVLSRRILELGNSKSITPTLFINPAHPSCVLASLLDNSPCVILESRQLSYLYQDRFIQRGFTSIYRERLLADPQRMERIVSEQESDSLEAIQGLSYPAQLTEILEAFGEPQSGKSGFNFVHLPWWSSYQKSFPIIRPFNQVVIDALTLPKSEKALLMIGWALEGLDFHAIKNKSIIILNSQHLTPIVSDYIGESISHFTSTLGINVLAKTIGNSRLYILSRTSLTSHTPTRMQEHDDWKEREIEVFFDLSQEHAAKSSVPFAQLDLLNTLLRSPETHSPSRMAGSQTSLTLDPEVFTYLTGRTP